MRLSNKNNTPVITFVYTIVGIIFILGVIGYLMEISKFDVLGNKAWILLLIPVLLLIPLYVMGKPLFEYDSDGEALNFRNSHILYIFSKKNAKDEFPKYKLVKFNIINGFIFKRLYIYITSKKNRVIILKYDITYLTRKQIKDLKFSLNKVVKANMEIGHNDNTASD